MTVHELIEKLKRYPPNLPVVKINLLIDDPETENLDDNDLEILEAINQSEEPQPVLMLTFGHYVK